MLLNIALTSKKQFKTGLKNQKTPPQYFSKNDLFSTHIVNLSYILIII